MPEENVEKKEVQKDKPKLPIKTILIGSRMVDTTIFHATCDSVPNQGSPGWGNSRTDDA